jgi:seryl-tRNA synthetase
MLDWRKVTQEKEAFKIALKNRGFASGEVERISSSIDSISKERVQKQQKCDAMKAERNKASAQVGQLMKTGDKAAAQKIIDDGKRIGVEIEGLEKELESSEILFQGILEVLPNIPHESVPIGKTEKDNPIVREWGTKKSFDFEPRAHDEIGQNSGLIDFERAGKISGARFTFLRAGLSQLEWALASYMLNTHVRKGYEQISTPFMVSEKTMYGMGQLPKFREDVYKIEGQDKFLIPTAEVPVTSFFAGELLEESELPYRFAGFSPCFRSEAGSYGKDTKGLIRQHQFFKVELVKFSTPEKSLEELEMMVQDAESILQGLEIPYRVIHLCTGDMGFNSRKTYDIEVWLPGSVFDASGGDTSQLKRGCYREISSCSDCGDFQARRSGIRYRPKGAKQTAHIHTLNGSGLAVGRTLVAVMENYQQKDGSIKVPKVLVPYMNGLELIQPLKK